ncbi:MAG TPA: hypothetical protein VH684_13945 [Xanthobacteraceae bacterium]|jgi:hypothetical protein
MTAAQEITTRIEIPKNGIGLPPSEFEFQRTGEGNLGIWKVVLDDTATGGTAIEHLSTDQHEDRFPLAIYKPLSAESVQVNLRLKIVSGVSPTAGIAVSLRNPDNYYAVSVNALEQRVDLFLFSGGKSKRIDGAETNVMWNRWHSLGVIVNDDHFSVSLDRKTLFTGFDRTRMKDGRVALWTQEDNVTRFNQIEIRVLRAKESR